MPEPFSEQNVLHSWELQFCQRIVPRLLRGQRRARRRAASGRWFPRSRGDRPRSSATASQGVTGTGVAGCDGWPAQRSPAAATRTRPCT